MSSLRDRGGYALLWAVVMVAVFAALVAAAMPALYMINDTTRVSTTANMLQNIAAGVDSFNVYVILKTKSYTTPNNLTELVDSIANGAPAGCTTSTYTTTAEAAWINHAPYGILNVPTNGFWTPLGRLNIAPSRTPLSPGVARTSTSDKYFIQIPSVDVNLARKLDVYVDGTPGQTVGIVHYTAPASDSTVLVSYDVKLANPTAC